jgi:hypothetical protein
VDLGPFPTNIEVKNKHMEITGTSMQTQNPKLTGNVHLSNVAGNISKVTFAGQLIQIDLGSSIVITDCIVSAETLIDVKNSMPWIRYSILHGRSLQIFSVPEEIESECQRCIMYIGFCDSCNLNLSSTVLQNVNLLPKPSSMPHMQQLVNGTRAIVLKNVNVGGVVTINSASSRTSAYIAANFMNSLEFDGWTFTGAVVEEATENVASSSNISGINLGFSRGLFLSGTLIHAVGQTWKLCPVKPLQRYQEYLLLKNLRWAIITYGFKDL